MTLKEIIYDILADLKETRNEELYQRLKESINSLRALFLKREFERNGHNGTVFNQTVAFQLETPTEFDGIDITSLDLTLRRSTRTLPQPLRSKSTDPFLSVSTFRHGLANGQKSRIYSFLPMERLAMMCHHPFGSLGNFYTIANNAEGLRLYVLDDCLIDNVFVTDPWDDPNEALEIATDSSCFNDDKEYPLSSDLIYQIKTTIIQDKARFISFNDNTVNIDKNENQPIS